MHRSYTPEEKARALDLLEEKAGDVSYVSYLTGISERTLYTWKKHLKYMQMEGERETPPPLHWLRQQPERQERLQQQQQKKRLQQQQRQEMTAFGMTHEELEEALKAEYVTSPFTNLHDDLILHLQHLNFGLTDEPEMAHRKALAFSRIFNIVQQLEEMIRLEKPQVSIIKYEYPDQSYHDIPPWSNAVHERATQAYEAVIAEAKRQYEEQRAEINNPSDTIEEDPAEADHFASDIPLTDMEELRQQASLTVEEILAKPFTPDDFIPKHTGYHKYFLGEDPYSRHKQSQSDSDSDIPPDPENSPPHEMGRG